MTQQSQNGSTGGHPPKKRVIIVGAGASGMSAAYALSLQPEKFDVVVYDKQETVGGSATSYNIPSGKYGASYINDGVQGASPVFHNTFKMLDDVLGFKSTEVGLQVSFGKGVDSFWSNLFPSELVDKFSSDIRKFGRVLKVIKTFEVAFAVIPVSVMLRLFQFSPDFGERMVFPLVALFFGTGNETPHISSAILERVFMDPNMRLFEYSDASFLASVPTMMAFPELSRVYTAWRDEVTSRGNVRVETGREASDVQRGTREARKRGGNILLSSRKVSDKGWSSGADVQEGQQEDQQNGGSGEERTEVFEELIMACDADSALKILGKSATWKEKKVLGSVLYKWDISTTHNDFDYMQKHYQMTYDPKYNAPRHDKESEDAFKFASENWKPLYLIKMYEHDRSKIEMSFDLTHYQPQFRGVSPTGPDGREPAGAPPTERQGPKQEGDGKGEAETQGKEPPCEKHVFQTIFLDKNISEQWTKDEISEDSIILEKWWKQQSHRWQHYAFVVPWMWTINGRNHTNYAGAWSVLNMHEIAITSGFAAAYRLGAPYPFLKDDDCARLFKLYLALSHMSRMRSEDRSGFFG